MKASDKIALLVSGRATMKEIKALEEQEALEAKQNNPDPAKHENQETDKHDNQETDYKKLYEELMKKKEEEKKGAEDKKDPEEPDYKKLYEEEAAKVTKLQQENIKKDFKKEEKPETMEDIMIKAYSHS